MYCHCSAGISNFDLSELRELWQMSRIKQAVVQCNSDPLSPDTLIQRYARLTDMQYQVEPCLWHTPEGLFLITT